MSGLNKKEGDLNKTDPHLIKKARTVGVSDALWGRVQTAAKDAGQSVSEYVSLALSAALDGVPATAPPKPDDRDATIATLREHLTAATARAALGPLPTTARVPATTPPAVRDDYAAVRCRQCGAILSGGRCVAKWCPGRAQSASAGGAKKAGVPARQEDAA